MKMPKWLKILMWCSFGFTMTAFAVSFWFSQAVYQGRCSTQECLWYWNASNWVALSSVWVLFGLGILYAVYVVAFRRQEWLQHWRSQPKRPVWFWVLYWACFAAYFALSNYARHHEELRSFGTMLFGLWALSFMGPMCYRQSNGRWQSLCIAVFLFIGLYELGSAWDSIGTSDLRHCLGQTYFQRVPVQSVGCEIIKAIPTPRYFAGRECPTSDLFAGCKSDYPFTFQSYNQRKAEGKVARVPLPWDSARKNSVRCEQTATGQKCWTE
jgi:hypothetical protein